MPPLWPRGLPLCPQSDFAGGGSGSLNGVLDQITGLEWVQAHIRSFGGDPQAVRNKRARAITRCHGL